MNIKYNLSIRGQGKKVIITSKENSGETIWSFRPLNDKDLIIFKKFINPSRFVLINDRAHVRVFDVESQSQVFEKHFNSKLSCGACFSRDMSQLYISYCNSADNGWKYYLASISIDDFSNISLCPLPKPLDLKVFRERSDGKLVFYYLKDNRWDLDEDDEDFDSMFKAAHGFQVVDLKTRKSEKIEMDYVVLNDMGDVIDPVFDSAGTFAVLVAGGNVEVVKNKSSEFTFIYKIMIVDLYSFEKKVLPVRNFALDQLTCDDEDDREMARYLVGRSPFKDEASSLIDTEEDVDDKDEYDEDGIFENYAEAYEKFFGNLYSIDLLEYDNCIWLCWRGCILRRMSLDNYNMSPLLVPYGKEILRNGEDAISKPFELRMLHGKPYTINQNEIILKHYWTEYRISLKGIDLESDREILPVLFTSEEDYGDDDSNDDMDWIVICTDDLDSDQGYMSALDEIIIKSKDIESVKNGELLRFKITDENKEMDEDIFFEKAVAIETGEDKTAEVLENFLKYKDAEDLYYDEEHTALCFAVYHLPLNSSRHVDIVLKYLAMVDFEHDVFVREELVPKLIDNPSYGLLFKLAVLFLDLDISDEIREEYKNKMSDFRSWFEDKDNQKIITAYLDQLSNAGIEVNTELI